MRLMLLTNLTTQAVTENQDLMETIQKNPAPAAGLFFLTDALGSAVTVEIDPELYEKAAIFKTAYWATERAYLYLSLNRETKAINVELRAKVEGGAPSTLEQLARDFCNALIDQQTRQYVLKETAAERDVLLAKAFGAGRSHLDPMGIS